MSHNEKFKIRAHQLIHDLLIQPLCYSSEIKEELENGISNFALGILIDLIDSTRNEKIKLAAVDSLLDRLGPFKTTAQAKTEVKGTDISHTDLIQLLKNRGGGKYF